MKEKEKLLPQALKSLRVQCNSISSQTRRYGHNKYVLFTKAIFHNEPWWKDHSNHHDEYLSFSIKKSCKEQNQEYIQSNSERAYSCAARCSNSYYPQNANHYVSSEQITSEGSSLVKAYDNLKKNNVKDQYFSHLFLQQEKATLRMHFP